MQSNGEDGSPPKSALTKQRLVVRVENKRLVVRVENKRQRPDRLMHVHVHLLSYGLFGKPTHISWRGISLDPSKDRCVSLPVGFHFKQYK